MVIDYAKGYDVAPEDQIKSLRDNIQLAFDEQQMMLKRQTVELLDSIGLNVQDLMTNISDVEGHADDSVDNLDTSLRTTEDVIIDLLKMVLTEFEIDVDTLNLDSLNFKGKMTAIKNAFKPKLKEVLKDVKDTKEKVQTLEQQYANLESRVSALEE